jgi:hypothetical protein
MAYPLMATSLLSLPPILWRLYLFSRALLIFVSVILLNYLMCAPSFSCFFVFCLTILKVILFYIFSPRFWYPRRRIGKWMYSSTHSLLLHEAHVNDEHHTRRSVRCVKLCVGPREGPSNGDKRERNILPGIESRFLSFPASSVVTILTELWLYLSCSCG